MAKANFDSQSRRHHNPRQRRRRRRSHSGSRQKEVPGTDNSDVKVVWNDGTAKVSGKVRTQEEKEKIILAAGNIEGVNKTDDDISTDNGQAQSRMYTVQSGDTLSGIAKEMYGDASEYHKIFKANQPLLKDPDHIYPGQVLRIP